MTAKVSPRGKDWQIPANSVVVEAECPVQENRPRHSAIALPEGGYMYGSWTVSGRFAEWDVTVPEAGAYRLYLRYTSPEDAVETFRINGRSAGDAFAFQLPETGDWRTCRWVSLPQKFQLGSGRNKLKMIAVSGMLNIDKFVLVKE